MKSKKEKTDKRHFGLNIDMDTYEKLREIAKLEHRSISSQVIYFIEQGVQRADVRFE